MAAPDLLAPFGGLLRQLGVPVPVGAPAAALIPPFNSADGAGASGDGLWLRWEGLVYEVALPRDRKAPDAPTTKRILHGLSGQVLPGQLLACMGPSGSGKTSLMKILAGRRPATAGALLANGAPLDVPAFRRASGFVAQATTFLDTLTVRETVACTALLRLDRSVPIDAKLARVEEVLAAVDLLKCGDSRIGNDITGGISGGERRRLSIGVEVVHKPRLLLLDEPTSGLDATSAQMVGATLRRMSALNGTSSLCSIHQPRATLLALFDVLLLLAEGRTVYFGPTGLAGPSSGAWPLGASPFGAKADPTAGVLPYFAAAGHVCPPLENAADWLLDLVHRGAAASALRNGPADLEQQHASTSDTAARIALAEAFAAAYAASPLAAVAMTPPATQPPPLTRAQSGALFPTNWIMQFKVLWWRTMLYKLREPAAVITQASTALVMPLIIGGVFGNIPLSQAAVSDRLGAISFVILMQAFMCIDQILLFPKERSVYLRDHAVGLHSTSSFFVARTLAEMPFILLFAAANATILYWMCGFQREGGKFFVFVAIIMAVTEAGAALLTSLGALSETMEVGNLLATLIIIILTLMDGFYRNLADLPLWCRWVAKLSFLGYGVQAAAVNEFRGLTFTCTPEEALLGCIPDGESFLKRLSMENTSIGANIGYTLLLAFGSRCVAYLALRFLYTGQSFRERLAQP